MPYNAEKRIIEMKTQFIINTVSSGKVKSYVIAAHDKAEARKHISPAVKIITVKRVVKLSDKKEVY